MTGPEHYREAERLIEDAREMQVDTTPGWAAAALLAEAQVHATLALAAAMQRPEGEILADPNNEGCADHLPTASMTCTECARRQGLIP